MKTTRYFKTLRLRPDRVNIKEEWIRLVMLNPEAVMTQSDARIRIWSRIPEMNNRYLRVVLPEDRETVYNAFVDRSFKP